MALEAILPLIAEPFIKYVVSPAVRHISYAFRCDSKVETLQNQAQQLKSKRFERQKLVEDATRNGEEIFPAVTEWLATAGKEIEDAEQLIQGKAQAKNKCFMGLCPNLKTRYQLSKKAHKKALAVGKKFQEAGSGPISFRPPLQPIVEPSVYNSEALPSRVLILNQIMDALKDPKYNLIGVYGMGGVGKTTLAKEVRGRAAEKALFETVVLVAVSQRPDVRKIQGEIADSLGLKFDAEEIPGRASRLHQRLQKEKALIIFDDVWQKLNLNDIGVPFGCKILVTSRRKQVLHNEMGTQKEFSLDVLEEEETWRLFEMSTSNIADPELHHVAKEIAKRCVGLPLLILKVAADLRNKEMYVWSDMLNRLSDLENTEIYEKVHSVIESSYENLLDEEAKSLFLLCALFVNPDFPINYLVLYGVGLGLFKRIDSIEGVRNRVNSLILKLKGECLLLDTDKPGYVKIHDVVRDVALVISSRVHNVFVGDSNVRSVDLQNKNRTRICLPYCDTLELPGVLECPEAELFEMFVDDGYHDIPWSFFEGVPRLKVLLLEQVSILPSSLDFLRDLKVLFLYRCQFDSVAVIAALKQLEILSFSKSDIKELTGEIKGLTRLKVLDLSSCLYLEVIPANVLSNLSSLEELYMLSSFHGWDVEGNASLVELKSLSRLTTLEIEVRDDKVLPKDWFFNGVEYYSISIGNWTWPEDEYETSRKILKLELNTSAGLMHRIKEFVKRTETLVLRNVKGVENLLYASGELGMGPFRKLRNLEIIQCDTLKSLFSHSLVKYLPQMQELEVNSCGNIEAIVNGGREEEEIKFTHLNSLKLIDLPNLMSFCRTSVKISLPKITKLEVFKCMSLKYVFTTSMGKSLEQLKTLKISCCDLIEEIILSEGVEEIEEEDKQQNMNSFVFPKLEYLRLKDLQKLKRFSCGHPINAPSLRILKVDNCSEIESLVPKSLKESDDKYIFFTTLVTIPNLAELYLRNMNKLRYIWSEDIGRNSTPNLKNVRKVRVSGCPDLKYVFSASVAHDLHQLQKLKINECGVEVIIGNAKDETTEWPNLTHLKVSSCHNLISINSKVTFPNIEVLCVEKLDKLRNLCSEDIVGLKNLQSVRVFKCPDLKYVFPASVACGIPQLQRLEIEECSVEMIIGGKAKDETFEWPNLKDLVVVGCKGLKYAFTNSTAKSLKKLEKLKITGCELMEEIILREEVVEGNINTTVFSELQLLQLMDLPNLRRFSSGYPIDFLSLRVLEIQRCSEIENFISKFMSRTVDECLFNELVIFSNLRELSISGMDKLRYIWSTALSGLKNLQSVIVSHCPELKYVFPASLACSLLQLQNLQITYCSVEVIIGKAKDKTIEVKWPNLTYLGVVGCHNLTICNSKWDGVHVFSNLEVLSPDMKFIMALLQFKIPANFFSKAKKLVLGSVSSATAKFHVALLHFLALTSNIDGVEVCHCSVKELFKFQGLYGKQVMTALPQIRELRLHDLYCLNQIWWQSSKYHALLFRSLEILRLRSCGEVICVASSAAPFQNMKELEIDRCDQMRYVMASSVAKSMVQLETLRVKSCNTLMEIVADGNEGTTEEIIFPKLETLELSCLQSLTSFCSGHYAFNFPCLERVITRKCPNLRNFCLGSIITPLLNTVSDQRSDWNWDHYWEGDLNTTIEYIYKNLFVGFPSIEFVRLSMYPILKEKWAAQFPFRHLHKLKRLVVDNCEHITSAIPSHLLCHLSDLEVLIVDKCNSVEQVFNLEGAVADQPITLNTFFVGKKLCELQLIDLPLLRSVWSKDLHEILSFEKLRMLNVQNCGSLTCIFDLSITSSLPSLQHLQVINCESVEYIIVKAEDQTMQQYQRIFPLLETIYLKSLTSLLSFCSADGFLECPYLKFIGVVACPNMDLCSSIFPKAQDSCSMTSEAKEEKMSAYKIAIPKLEEMKVEWKNLADYSNADNQVLSRLRIINLTGSEDEYAIVLSNMLQNFPNLDMLIVSDASMEEMNLNELRISGDIHNDEVSSVKKLKLINLPKLMLVVRDDSHRVPLFQILVEFEVHGCSSLKMLVPPSVSFQNLTSLIASKCDGMKNLINASTARSLVQLRRMVVRDCKTMQEIVAVAQEEVEYEIRFSQLEHLELDDLPCLTGFCSGSYVFHFPSLGKVFVIKCPNMKTFSEQDVTTPKLKNVKAGRREYEWEWEGSLNNTVKSLHEDQVCCLNLLENAPEPQVINPFGKLELIKAEK